MIKTIISATFLVCSVLAAPHHFPQRSGWEWYDFFQGVAIGWYPPMITKVHDDDCFSNFFSYGVSLISFSAYFDKEFDIYDWKTWLTFIADLGVHGLSSYGTFSTCAKQLKLARADPDQNLATPSEILGINEENGFLSADTEASPKVGKGKWTGKESIIWILTIVLGVVSWYGEFESEYYFFALG